MNGPALPAPVVNPPPTGPPLSLPPDNAPETGRPRFYSWDAPIPTIHNTIFPLPPRTISDPAPPIILPPTSFNQWQSTTWMKRDQWGVWEITLPDGPDGKPAIAHGSRIKVSKGAHTPKECPGWTEADVMYVKGCDVHIVRLASEFPAGLKSHHSLKSSDLRDLLLSIDSAAPHFLSNLQIRMQLPNGGWVDRLPAYIQWAT